MEDPWMAGGNAADYAVPPEPTSQSTPGERDIGDEAVWSLSTAKPGNGVIQLREDDKDTYWQSDGAHPHMINIQFYKKMTITAVAFYVDYSVDESYCPKTISIRAGNTFHDLAEVTLVEMKEGGCEMNGWNRVALHAAGDGDAPLRAFVLQFCVVEMYQNGRDTHVRQLKIFGPRQPTAAMYRSRTAPTFTEPAFTQFSAVR